MGDTVTEKVVRHQTSGGLGIFWLFVLFLGEPDIVDAIISWIMRQP